jgi:hypothetical protein
LLFGQVGLGRQCFATLGRPGGLQQGLRCTNASRFQFGDRIGSQAVYLGNRICLGTRNDEGA